MAKTMTTKERAAEIRKALKAKGWNQRMVSVRVRYGGTSASIYLTIRHAAVNTAEAAAIAKQAQHIDLCEASGEILAGGNTYVHTEHTDAVKATLALRHEEALERALDELDASNDSRIVPVSAHAGVSRGDYGQGYKVQPGESVKANRIYWQFERGNLQDIAYRIALMDTDQQQAAGK